MELFTFGIMNSSILFAASLSSACRLVWSSITRSPTVSLVRLSSAAWGKTTYFRNKYLKEGTAYNCFVLKCPICYFLILRIEIPK